MHPNQARIDMEASFREAVGEGPDRFQVHEVMAVVLMHEVDKARAELGLPPREPAPDPYR